MMYVQNIPCFNCF